MNSMSIRVKGLAVFLLCLPVLHFLTQKWIPYYQEYSRINEYSFVNWENQLIFLFISLILIVFITILIGSLLAAILNRHHCNVEFSTLIGSLTGLFVGGGLMIVLAAFGNDVAGLNTIVFSISSGFGVGIFLGIRNEIEDDERVC